ncbi:hypothetical protein ASG90_06880 [Nocardioides sp. Soil797]|nr:hypothetical protein ASG90_06880 [Nocardioides sp. Soil797]
MPAQRHAEDGPADTPAYLPEDLTSFQGRRREIADVKRILADCRMVTLTGVGGVGKTRLALRVARDLSRQFPDGVAWIELADLRDPSMLAQTILNLLAIPEKVGRGAETVLVNHVRSRRMLLVLDNCEHLLAACAELADSLLRAGPGVRILATSRQALSVSGEFLVPVSPLRVPTEEEGRSPGIGAQNPAMALFAERASAVVPGFEITPANQAAVAEVCRRLEGVPLAIELASAKVRVLAVEDLAERLDARLRLLRRTNRTGPERHQTIQATIDWSEELCTTPERILWMRASVFAGGFGAEAAEHVCSGGDLPTDLVLDALDGLVDKSILLRNVVDGRVRFRLLEPLREHGQARLHDVDEAQEMRERHLRWARDLVDQACMQWFGPSQASWCITLRQEHPNIRAAAEFCLEDPSRHQTGLELLGDPWFLWVALFLDEGRLWLDRVLEVAPEPTVARAKVLATAAYVAALQGDRTDAEMYGDESRAIAESEGATFELAYASHALGLSALFHDPEESVRRLSSALELYDHSEAYDDYPMGLRIQLGLAFLFVGDSDNAEEQFRVCEDLAKVTGEQWLHSYALYGLGFLARTRGDCDEALTLTRQAIEIKRFFGDLLGLAVSVDLAAWLAAECGDAREAAVLLGGSSVIWDRFGVRLFGSDDWLAEHDEAKRKSSEQLGPRAFATAVTEGEAMSLDEAVDFALNRSVRRATSAKSVEAKLTPREQEIAYLVADGLSNKAIAERLVIARRTAEGHVEKILTKLDFHSRSQIAAWIGERRADREPHPV